jgi:threonine/homoserine/homoserine lactone efflux protein
VGGVFRWLADQWVKRRGFNAAQTARVENAGILTASGLIAGEALMGLLYAGLRAYVWAPPKTPPQIFANPLYLAGLAVLAGLAWLMIRSPMKAAGDPNEPAPPSAMM